MTAMVLVQACNNQRIAGKRKFGAFWAAGVWKIYLCTRPLHSPLRA